MSGDEEKMRRAMVTLEGDAVMCRDSLWTIREFVRERWSRADELTQDEKNCIEALRRQVAGMTSAVHQIFSTIDDLDNA